MESEAHVIALLDDEQEPVADGRWLYFVRSARLRGPQHGRAGMDRQAICTLSLQAGGEPKRLTSLSAKQMWPPSVSPDGKSLVFAYRELNGNADIYALKVADGALTQLTRGPNSNGHPVYAPDGKHMAFSSDRAKGGEYELWEMRPDGSALRQITHLARGPDRRCSYPRYFQTGVPWSSWWMSLSCGASTWDGQNARRLYLRSRRDACRASVRVLRRHGGVPAGRFRRGDLAEVWTVCLFGRPACRLRSGPHHLTASRGRPFCSASPPRAQASSATRRPTMRSEQADGARVGWDAVTHGYGASYQLVNVQRSGANAVLRPVARNRAVVGSVASASAARERHTRPGRQTWTGGCRREGAHGQVDNAKSMTEIAPLFTNETAATMGMFMGGVRLHGLRVR